MNESQQQSGRKLLLLWAIVATLLGLVSTSVALFLSFHARRQSPSLPSAGASPFSALREDSVIGRYKWTEGNEEIGIITLSPNHTFIPPKGRQEKVHQWEIGRDALLVMFATGVQRFTIIESPGIYLSSKSDGRIVRMEKEP
jgi:hypothetical protein